MFKKFLKFLPSIFLMSLIFYLSSKPTDSVGLSGSYRYIFFKSLHIFVYFSLYISYTYAGIGRKTSLVLTIAYGISDEVHQSFTPGRTSSLNDLLYDTAGGVLGLLLKKTKILL